MYNRNNTIFVKNFSDLPVIKFSITEAIMEQYDLSDDMFKNCAVTFSMIDEDSGFYKIANKPGTLKIIDNLYEYLDETLYTLEYYLTLNDVKSSGIFRGEFKVTFLGDNCGTITFPSDEPLVIVIKDSITRVDVLDSATLIPTPTIPLIPPYFYGTYSSNNASLGDNRPLSSEISIFDGTQVSLPSMNSIAINWNSAVDDYIWFAIPSGNTIKTSWRINSFVNGDIGGSVSVSGNLFPDYVSITVNLTNPPLGNLTYLLYISNYQFKSSQTVKLEN